MPIFSFLDRQAPGGQVEDVKFDRDPDAKNKDKACIFFRRSQEEGNSVSQRIWT
jgi:hypothetical protein